MPIDTRQTAHQYAVERMEELGVSPQTLADKVKVNLLNAIFQEIAEMEIQTTATMQALANRLTTHFIPEILRLSVDLVDQETLTAMLADWNTQPNFISVMAESITATLGVTHIAPEVETPEPE